jgi:hypothetical protein
MQYADSIIISSEIASDDDLNSYTKVTYRTLPHEIGHILINSAPRVDDHLTKGGLDMINLMALPFRIEKQVTDSRRITSEQAKKMLGGRPNLLTSPP